MTRQLPLDLSGEPSYRRDDFLPARANAVALAWIERWPDWPGPALALAGPSGSGKTHLLRIWAERARARLLTPADLSVGAFAAVLDAIGDVAAVALDDAQAVAGDADGERQLFHLFNWLRERGGWLALAAALPPSRWPVALPDLASRLRTAQVAAIDAPDDALLAAVLVKLFRDRQVQIGGDVIDYLIRRIDRSLAAARAIVEAADRQALAQKRPVSVKLLSELFATDDG
jgi:DnaA regulatory inactivator Hda